MLINELDNLVPYIQLPPAIAEKISNFLYITSILSFSFSNSIFVILTY